MLLWNFVYNQREGEEILSTRIFPFISLLISITSMISYLCLQLSLMAPTELLCQKDYIFINLHPYSIIGVAQDQVVT